MFKIAHVFQLEMWITPKSLLFSGCSLLIISDGSEIRHLEQHYPKSLSPSLSHPLKEGKAETHQN
jgi:hypothetical protein